MQAGQQNSQDISGLILELTGALKRHVLSLAADGTLQRDAEQRMHSQARSVYYCRPANQLQSNTELVKAAAVFFAGTRRQSHASCEPVLGA